MGDTPRKPSASWFRPSVERRELDVAPLLTGAMDLLRARMAEAGGDPDGMGTVWQRNFAADVHRIVTGAWDAGAGEAASVRSMFDAEHEIRQRLEATMRAHGLRVPTDPLPSDPPVVAPTEAAPLRPEPPTRPRTPSAIRLQQWGLVELWLAEDDGRGVVLRAPDGLQVTAIDPARGEVLEQVGADEDPSRCALRAISRMNDAD